MRDYEQALQYIANWSEEVSNSGIKEIKSALNSIVRIFFSYHILWIRPLFCFKKSLDDIFCEYKNLYIVILTM